MKSYYDIAHHRGGEWKFQRSWDSRRCLEAEESWKKSLVDPKLSLHNLREEISKLAEKSPFTKEEFKLIEKAISTLDEVTGNKKHW